MSQHGCSREKCVAYLLKQWEERDNGGDSATAKKTSKKGGTKSSSGPAGRSAPSKARRGQAPGKELPVPSSLGQEDEETDDELYPCGGCLVRTSAASLLICDGREPARIFYLGAVAMLAMCACMLLFLCRCVHAATRTEFQKLCRGKEGTLQKSRPTSSHTSALSHASEGGRERASTSGFNLPSAFAELGFAIWSFAFQAATRNCASSVLVSPRYPTKSLGFVLSALKPGSLTRHLPALGSVPLLTSLHPRKLSMPSPLRQQSTLPPRAKRLQRQKLRR